MKFRARETYDSSSTPKAGETKRPPKTLAQVDLAILTGKMAETVQRAKENDPAELRKTIAKLRQELNARPANAPFDQSHIELMIDKAVTEAVAKNDRQWKKTKQRIEECSQHVFIANESNPQAE